MCYTFLPLCQSHSMSAKTTVWLWGSGHPSLQRHLHGVNLRFLGAGDRQCVCCWRQAHTSVSWVQWITLLAVFPWQPLLILYHHAVKNSPFFLKLKCLPTATENGWPLVAMKTSGFGAWLNWFKRKRFRQATLHWWITHRLLQHSKSEIEQIAAVWLSVCQGVKIKDETAQYTHRGMNAWPSMFMPSQLVTCLFLWLSTIILLI